MEQLIDHASMQSDRWLFIGSLLVLGFFAMCVMKYFVRQHERLIEDHAKARETYQSSLQLMVEETHKSNRELASIISRNSDALDNCTVELKQCREERR